MGKFLGSAGRKNIQEYDTYKNSFPKGTSLESVLPGIQVTAGLESFSTFNYFS